MILMSLYKQEGKGNTNVQCLYILNYGNSGMMLMRDISAFKSLSNVQLFGFKANKNKSNEKE